MACFYRIGFYSLTFLLGECFFEAAGQCSSCTRGFRVFDDCDIKHKKKDKFERTQGPDGHVVRRVALYGWHSFVWVVLSLRDLQLRLCVF